LGVKLDSKAAGKSLADPSPTKKGEKSMVKLNSVAKIGRDKPEFKDIKKHNSLNISINDKRNNMALENLKEDQKKPVEIEKIKTISDKNDNESIADKNVILETPKKVKQETKYDLIVQNKNEITIKNFASICW
jgi:hypothetical protein